MRIVLLGKPGAGKGTQGEFLAEALGIPRIVMSDLLKEEIRSGSELGKLIKGYMDEGRLVPDDVVYRVLERRLSQVPGGFILDGFPRNLKQAEWLDSFLASRGLELDAVLYFDVSDLTVLRRMMGRLVCERCGRTYNIFYDPPEDIRRCDCGGRLYQRSDDCYEKILKRLDVFREETEPLLEYYRRRGKLVSVDASSDIGTVRSEALRRLSEAGVRESS
ncbi:MAG: adenylate kinase [Candidatus Korarchaeota archaeon NZ13-K]|nr:MAG: adenylate kinase [Candidatus Korarchaeota archaeon NZ13-K]